MQLGGQQWTVRGLTLRNQRTIGLQIIWNWVRQKTFLRPVHLLSLLRSATWGRSAWEPEEKYLRHLIMFSLSDVDPSSLARNQRTIGHHHPDSGRETLLPSS